MTGSRSEAAPGAPGPPPALVLSCEHGGNRLPRGFPRADALGAALGTHRGWDPGALGLARHMASRLGAPLRYSTISRLVVEPNRSAGHAQLLSEWSRALPPPEQRRLVAQYHARHRARVRRAVEGAREGGTRAVVHVGVHTFTPELDGAVREVDIGILLDPASALEARVAQGWMEALGPGFAPTGRPLRILLNEPYDGRTDGLTTSLREHFAALGGAPYAGLELEVSQGLLDAEGEVPVALAEGLGAALGVALGWARAAP
jgi:predicted N-formylglutamate amidohydrolase